jgi:hypothetical protein
VYAGPEDFYRAEFSISPEDMQKCIDTDDVWELQWYPDTPIGFHKVHGSSLELVMAEALRIESEYKERK